MTGSPRSKYYKDVKDSDILIELLDKHGVENEVDDTEVTHKEMVQYNSTDWDFMMCRADANSLLCFPGNGTIKFAKPDLTTEAVKTLRFGSDIIDLDAEIDARHQYKSVKATAWNPADQALVDGIEAQPADVPQGGNLEFDSLADVLAEDDYAMVHSGNITTSELQQWADAKMLKQRLAKIRGKATVTGTSLINPGEFVELVDVGERFEGKVFVTGVRHQMDLLNGWRTFIQFGLNPEWFAETYKVQQAKAGAMLPAIEGLQVGVVTQLENDPGGENRILVRIPIIHADDEGIWSRVCTLDAGNNRGSFFLPEIGDEVIVGFLNNDPRHAIILGMCNSSSKPAPLTASDENHEKGYVSRSEMKMIFNDDKKSINIETPAGNKVIITEEDKAIKLEDQNGNKVTMDAAGIKGESSKDINFSINSGTIEVKDAAGNTVKIEASGVTVQSSAKVTIMGSTVELTAGTLTVNAGMATFAGVLQAATIIATASVVSPSYTPGAGNIL
jgi:Rhs element Vgr protein